MTRAEHDPAARRPRGPEDAWVDGPGGRFWGAYGAAGLFLADPDAGILMQLRVGWSHFGGTWGLPGGARKAGESAEDAAIRESDEEASVPPHLVRVLGTHVFDLGYWTYTTVIATPTAMFQPVVGDAESVELRWVPLVDIPSLNLHPGVAASWPELSGALARLDKRFGGALGE